MNKEEERNEVSEDDMNEEESDEGR